MTSILRHTSDGSRKTFRPLEDASRDKAWERLRKQIAYGPAVRVKIPRGLG